MMRSATSLYCKCHLDNPISSCRESQITSLSGGGQSLSHTYNGLDTRVTTTQNSVSRTFKRDGAYVTDPVIGDGAAKYTPSISERRGSTTTFLHSGMKNADAQTNSSGSVSASRVYDAFGAELSSTGSWQGRFGYAGGFGYQEDDSGFKLLGHRYYDPSTGRFLTRDPAKDGRNWYAYCEGNAISYFDASGEARVSVGSRPVAPLGIPTGASHSFIFIEDEVTDDSWTISGGPEKPFPLPDYILGTPNLGNLVDRSGRYVRGGRPVAGNFEAGSMWNSSFEVVNDDRSGEYWFDRLRIVAASIEAEEHKYGVVDNNSNSFTFTVLDRSSLMASFRTAVESQHGYGAADRLSKPGTDKLYWPGFRRLGS